MEEKYIYNSLRTNSFAISLFLFPVTLLTSILGINENGGIDLSGVFLLLGAVITLIIIIYSLFKYFIGFKIEFYKDKIVYYKNKKTFFEIKKEEVIDFIYQRDSIRVVYEINNEKQDFILSPSGRKTLMIIASQLLEPEDYVLNENDNQTDKIDIEGEDSVLSDYELKDKFIVRGSSYILYIFIGIAVVFIIPAIILLIMYMKDTAAENDYFEFAIMFGFFSFLGIFGILAYYKEKLTYIDGVLTYVKVFKKAQSAKVTDIKYLYVGLRGNLFKVDMLDSLGNSLINFLDDGTAFRTPDLLGTLEQHGVKRIPEHKYYELKKKLKK